MNYYIDFDNTLYNTPLLKKKMLNELANQAKLQKGIDIIEECNKLFDESHIYDIYELAKFLSNKYDLELSPMINSLNDIISNSSNFVFEDVIPFLQNLHSEGNNVFMLSYAFDNLEYQTAKILGSGLSKYFDALYITSKQKYELDIDYSNGIFIDDNPDDLKGIYSKGAKEVIRLRRKENKYSIYNIEINDIKEYEDLTQIKIGG